MSNGNSNYGGQPYGGGVPQNTYLTPQQLGWVGGQGVYPVAPFNGNVLSPFFKGCLDLRWDNPALLARNSSWKVVGVNIYRSDVGERGPYYRVNDYPIAGSFYRDQTENTLISNEIVSWDTSWLARGDAPNHPGLWALKTQTAIVKSYEKDCIYGNSNVDVNVTIDGVEVPVFSVFGRSGEVVLDTNTRFDVASQRNQYPLIPDASSTVLISYHTSKNFVRSTRLDQKVHYRITTVALSDETFTGYSETPLEYSQPLTVIRVENMDYIWRESVARNRWILEQGGERVKVFIRKTAGITCGCTWDDRDLEYRKQPSSLCLKCYGTGYLGGYEGPWETIIAPPDVEKKVTQTERGRNIEYIYETWTGPSPLITQRDFIVNQANERHSIGPVRKPTNRGNILQQHFSINYLDEQDIRYKVPIDIPKLNFPETRVTIDARECRIRYPDAEYGPMTPPSGPSDHDTPFYPVDTTRGTSTPLITDKCNIEDSREHRGRTQVWENITY